jgi:glycosyltransferase involved in cell wall biosynthesis
MLTVIVPVYNESQSITNFHKNLKDSLSKINEVYEIIYINDGSTDESAQILNKLEEVKILHHNVNRGYGASLKTGITHSTGDRIAIIDCDNTYETDDLVKLFDESPNNEMVVGVRPETEGIRSLSKRILRFFASYAVSYKIPDLNSGLRIFTRRLAENVIHLLPNGFSFTSTITLACLYYSYDIAFIPITYNKRTGKSKIRPFADFSNFVLLITKIMVLFNPLRFFLPASFLFVIIGLLFLIRDLLHYDVAQASLLLITNGFILFAVGLLAEAIKWKK